MTTPAPGTNRRSRVVVLAATVALMLSLLPFASALAALSFSPATGGSSISADTVGGAYATLTGPTITADAAAQVSTGTITFSAPSGFIFDITSTPTIAPGASGLAGSCAAPTTTLVTCTITANTAAGTITFALIKVRPTAGTPLATGNMAIGGTATISGVSSGANAGTLTEGPGAASKLAFTRQPGNAAATANFSPVPIVAVQDQFGNTVATDGSTVVAMAKKAGTPTSGGPGTLTCPDATASAGLATFTTCKFDTAGVGYQLRATSGALTLAESVAFSVWGSASQLVFTQQPSSSTINTAFGTQPQVSVRDANGTTLGDFTGNVTIEIKSGTGTSGAVLTCTGTTKILAAVAGVATFSGCKIDTAGTAYKLTATIAGPITADSSSFNILGAAASLQVCWGTAATCNTTAPTTFTGGTTWGTQPEVRVLDSVGNIVTTDSSTIVTLQIAPGTPTSGGPGTPTCTGGLLKAVTNGVADFGGCTIDKSGTGYKLRATASSLTSGDSSSFNVAVGPATKLGFAAQPGASTGSTAFTIQPVVAIQDAGGNTVTTASATTITLAIGTNPGGGTLTCTGGLSKVTVSGVATFSGCQINNAGVGYTITADDGVGGFAAITSSAFNVTAPTAVLTLTSVPTGTTYREYVTLTAQFGSFGATRAITLQRLSPVDLTWVTLANLTTNAAGNASFTYGPPYNTQFQAIWSGSPDLGAATSNTLRVNVRYKVTLRPGPGTTTFVRPGTRITYKATARPIAPAGLQRVTFLIYKRVSGVWAFRTSATVPTIAGVGSFSWRWSRGEWYIRARGNATIYNVTAYSPLSKVTAR